MNTSTKASIRKSLKEYNELIETIAKIEFKKLSSAYLIDFSELVNIGTQVVHHLCSTSDISQYNKILLQSVVRSDYRILTTTTIPVSYLQTHKNTECIAIYATEHQFYQAYMKLTTDNKLQVHCTSQYDRAIVYGLH